MASRLAKEEGSAQLRLSRFFINTEGLICRKAHLDGVEQIVVPTTLRDKVLYLSHYPATSGHPGGRRLFYMLRQRYYWPSMSGDAYSTVRMCPDCAKARIKLRKHNSELKTFPPSGPLEYIAIDILGELPRTPRGHRYLLVMRDRYSKLTRTVPLRKITAETVAQAFITNWVFVYGAPVKLLSDNGSQFTSRFFLAVCKILSIESVFTTAYHPQTNGQVERFNRTLVSTLRHYLADNQRDWDQCTDSLPYGYNCTVNRMIGMRPFELVLSRTPSPLSLQQPPMLAPSASRAHFKLRFLAWLRGLIATADKNLLAGQDRYKNDFDKRIRLPTPEYQVGDQVLVNQEAALRSEERTVKDRVNNKLAPRTEGPFPVVKVDDHTVTVLRGTGLKDRISRDRVVKSPPLHNAVEDTTPSLAGERDDGDTPPSGENLRRGEDTADQALEQPRADSDLDNDAPSRTPSEGRTPGLMDAVTNGQPERVISRLVPLSLATRRERPTRRTVTTASAGGLVATRGDGPLPEEAQTPSRTATSTDTCHAVRNDRALPRINSKNVRPLAAGPPSPQTPSQFGTPPTRTTVQRALTEAMPSLAARCTFQLNCNNPSSNAVNLPRQPPYQRRPRGPRRLRESCSRSTSWISSAGTTRGQTECPYFASIGTATPRTTTLGNRPTT